MVCSDVAEPRCHPCLRVLQAHREPVLCWNAPVYHLALDRVVKGLQRSCLTGASGFQCLLHRMVLNFDRQWLATHPMQGSQQAYLLGGAVLAGMPVVVRLSSPQRLKVHSRHNRTETALLQAALLLRSALVEQTHVRCLGLS